MSSDGLRTSGPVHLDTLVILTTMPWPKLLTGFTRPRSFIGVNSVGLLRSSSSTLEWVDWFTPLLLRDLNKLASGNREEVQWTV